MAGLRVTSEIAASIRRIEAEDAVQFEDLWAALAAIVFSVTELTKRLDRLQGNVDDLIGDGHGTQATQANETDGAEEAWEGAAEAHQGREGDA
jgi:hypothetical protein